MIRNKIMTSPNRTHLLPVTILSHLHAPRRPINSDQLSRILTATGPARVPGGFCANRAGYFSLICRVQREGLQQNTRHSSEDRTDYAGMLDLKTTLIILLINATLQGAVWVFVWISQRHLFELKFIAAAYIAFAAGLLLVVLRGPEPAPWHIVLDNTIINLALALVADGLARFLSRKPLPALGIGVVIFSVLFWSLALALDPANVAIRTHGATGVTILCIAVMIWTLASDRSQPRLLRWITIFFLSCHAAASVARSVAIHVQETFREMPAATTNAQAIYFFEINVFITAYFLCQLLMVVINLVENALKYSPEDTPVTVSIVVAGGDIVIGVRDRGIGIPEAERRSVGRRFFRASNTRAATGTGLGLYNARKLLEYHQGELSLEVPPDGGTLALIRLPLHIHSTAPQDPVA
jgi:hypothetical protein